jgi:hypothetical protein
MKANLVIQYPTVAVVHDIDITADDWQRYQEGSLEFSNISDVSLDDAEEWMLELI